MRLFLEIEKRFRVVIGGATKRGERSGAARRMCRWMDGFFGHGCMDGCLPYVFGVRISRWMPLSGGVTYINLTFDKRRKKGDRKKSLPALNWAQRDPLTHIHTHKSVLLPIRYRVSVTGPANKTSEIVCFPLFSTLKTTRRAPYFENPQHHPHCHQQYRKSHT